jgi:LPXTG-motif cell wall-anchored protein
MNDRLKNILFIGIGVAIVGTTALLISKRRKKVGKTPFRRKAIRYANKELKKFDNGKLKESTNQAYSLIKTYWDALGWSESRWSPTGTAWSSAFISYIKKQVQRLSP